MSTVSQNALFLDRDGIINIDHGYVFKIDDFSFIDGIFELVHLFLKHHYKIFIVTNQSGIGRDYYTQNDFEVLTKWMLNVFHKENIPIASVQYCPHTPEELCDCRKPKTGMIDTIMSTQNIDLNHSWLIGDKQSDIDLAKNANIAHTIAIGEKVIHNADLSFSTILECTHYLEENQDIIEP